MISKFFIERPVLANVIAILMVVVGAVALLGLPVAEYSANLIKKAVVGAGHADKAQIQGMVRRLLPGSAVGEADAADALAVAICHAHYAETRRTWKVPAGNKFE